jgi:non-ribosomal peptide synthetase component F
MGSSGTGDNRMKPTLGGEPRDHFAEELSAAVAEAPERPAVKLNDIVLSYGVLDQAVARAAGLLRAKGVGPDRSRGSTTPLRRAGRRSRRPRRRGARSSVVLSPGAT